MFGGGFGVMAAGRIAERLGIGHILWLPVAALALGFLLSLLLRETLPALVEARSAEP
jgi:hypothetical protein